jgi:Tfp pilus assembly protein PilE
MASSHATRSHARARHARRFAGEEGFGLIELMVAATVVLTGVLSAFLAFEASQRADSRGERTAAVAHRSQAELERIMALPYTSVAMESTPTNSGSKNKYDPLNYVVTGPPAEYQYDWNEPAKKEQFVTGGTLAPSSSWTDGKLTGTIYLFVTWVADACPSCAKSQDYKRVTLVLTTPGTARPFTTSTIVTK